MSVYRAKIEACARAAHEANRAYRMAIGEDPELPWEQAPEWQRASAIAGIEPALQGATPKESHEAWAKLKIEEGWTYGPIKDPEAKTHPCLLPYEQLPYEQQLKDTLYLAVVRAMGRALHIMGGCGVGLVPKGK